MADEAIMSESLGEIEFVGDSRSIEQIALEFALQGHERIDPVEVVKRATVFRDFLEPPTPPPHPPNQAASALLVVHRTEGATAMNVKDAGEQVTWEIAEFDADGAPIPTDTGSAAWASTDEAVLTVTPSADGYSAVGTITDAAVAGDTAGVTCSLDIGRTNEDGSPNPILLADAILVVAGDVATATLTGTVGPIA